MPPCSVTSHTMLSRPTVYMSAFFSIASRRSFTVPAITDIVTPDTGVELFGKTFKYPFFAVEPDERNVRANLCGNDENV